VKGKNKTQSNKPPDWPMSVDYAKRSANYSWTDVAVVGRYIVSKESGDFAVPAELKRIVERAESRKRRRSDAGAATGGESDGGGE